MTDRYVAVGRNAGAQPHVFGMSTFAERIVS
jgi:hypothetical protein